jgi:thioredoxin-related protein
MKRIQISLLVLFTLLMGSTAFAQNPEHNSGVEWQSLEEAQKKAKETGKKVLIFGYADWCTYCRKMRKETYSQDTVQKSLDSNFIPVQINAESEEEVVFNGKTYKSWQLAQYFQLKSFPTHYFIDDKGEVIGAQPGFLPTDVFIPMMDYIGEDKFGKISFMDYLNQQGIKLDVDQE